jgi:hypothetical protein
LSNITQKLEAWCYLPFAISKGDELDDGAMNPSFAPQWINKRGTGQPLFIGLLFGLHLLLIGLSTSATGATYMKQHPTFGNHASHRPLCSTVPLVGILLPV